MKNDILKKVMIATLLGLPFGYVQAQEAVAEAAPAETAEATVVEQEAPAVEVDGGLAAVEEAQTSAPAPVSAKFKNARKVLQELAKERNWKERWDNKKKRIMQIEDAEFECANPAEDKDFYVKREMAVKTAVLRAKASIISTINAEMSAYDSIDIPGTDVNKVLHEKQIALEKKLKEQRDALVKLLAQKNAAEAKALSGVSFGDRLNALMDAAIKKLDKDYDVNKIEAKYKAEFEKIKASFAQSKKEFEALEAEAEKLQNNAKERQESYVSLSSRMPLFGSTVIQQTESWDGKRYQVAVLVCWSKALEAAARTILTSGEFIMKPNENVKDINDWLDEQNPATMIGPRQYIDNNGDRWFIGVAARDYTGNSVARRRSKGLADLYARQMAVFCAKSDVETYSEAQTVMETDAAANSVLAESFAEKMSQKFENQTIRGLQKLYSGEVEHPITGSEIYVSIFGINASMAKEALEIEKTLVETATLVNRAQAVEQGRKQAREEVMAASKNRPEDVQKGYSQHKQDIQKGIAKKEAEAAAIKAKNAKKGVQIKQAPVQQAAPSQKKAPTSGTFSGDTNISDDF